MQVHRFDQILHQTRLSVFSFLLGADQKASHPFGNQSDLSLLPVLPDPVRYVKEATLEKQHERHPLIIAVVVPFLVVVAQSWMSRLCSNVFALFVRQGERRGDPAVGVYDVIVDAPVVDTLDGLADQVVGGNDDAGEKEDGGRDPVVGPEHHVVNIRLVDEVADLDKARNGGHHSKYRHLDSKIKNNRYNITLCAMIFVISQFIGRIGLYLIFDYLFLLLSSLFVYFLLRQF